MPYTLLSSWIEREKKRAAEDIWRVEEDLYYKVLVIPDLDKELKIKANASDYTIREVLSMKCEDENWRPVAFILKSLNGTERNYKIHDKEILAVIRYLKTQRHFSKGRGK